MDIVIPIHQIFDRGLERVYFSLLSLSYQTTRPKTVWVMNSSRSGEFRMLDRLISKFDFVEHIGMDNKEFNKCKLLNAGIKLSDEKFVMCTDADYIFRSDFVDVCNGLMAEGTLLLKAVYELPKMRITDTLVKLYSFPKGKINFYKSKATGENLANGACQLTAREWFLQNPYDERMSNLGGMDNLCVMKARDQKMDIKWIEDSHIFHQWHKISKLKIDPQFEKNQDIIREYENSKHNMS